MIKLENTEVVGWEAAIRGMRNPMNSWEKSDSNYRPIICKKCDSCENFIKQSWAACAECEVSRIIDAAPDGFMVGPNDHKLMMSLAKGGPVHAKYRRMINVYVDITAPFYWWKEFDTYKVGTVANSCSTMHKIHAKEFTLDDFSHEHLLDDILNADDIMEVCDCGNTTALGILETTVGALNFYRDKYLEAKTKPMKDESKRAEVMKKYWWQMIQLLPTSYNQKRTVMLNYEVLHNIYHSRKNHKLDEWHVVCDWIKSLPYSEIITGEEAETE